MGANLMFLVSHLLIVFDLMFVRIIFNQH